MNSYTRADRVSELIKQSLSEIISKQIKDPRLEMATITHVKVARDLKSARIYFTTHGGSRKVDAAMQGFQSATGFVKRELGQKLRLRYMPQIQFFYDDTLDQASRIDSILKSLHDQ